MPSLLDKNLAFLEQLYARQSKEDQKKMKDAKEPGTIEMMQVTLKIPKACLEYANENLKDVDAWLENSLVKAVLAEYEDRSFGTWRADEIGLSPVFWELLNDKRFHPDLDKRIPMKIK